MSRHKRVLLIGAALLVGIGCVAGASARADPATVEVSIPLTTVGWHLISLPLEPVNKTVLYSRPAEPGDPAGPIDPDSIFFTSHAAGNTLEYNLLRWDPMVGAYAFYPPRPWPWSGDWYEVEGTPPEPWPQESQGMWWQGFWFWIDVPHDLSYTAYPLPASPEARCWDLSEAPIFPAGILLGACARVPDPYDPDVSTWPKTSLTNDIVWGTSPPPVEPTAWLPTSSCAGPDAWDSRLIDLPLAGFASSLDQYCTVSPSQVSHCGAPLPCIGGSGLTPGQGYYLTFEDPAVWLRLQAGQWP